MFYSNVCGNVERYYVRDEIDSQLRSELMTALQPAFAKISEMGIRYSALPGHTGELASVLNGVLSSKWSELRGIEIVSFGVSSVKASEEDENMIKELQRNAAFRNPNMAAAHLVGAQAAAMQSAAKNESGAAMAFMGMNFAQNAGGANAQSLFQMGSQTPPASPYAPPAQAVPVSPYVPPNPVVPDVPYAPPNPATSPVSVAPPVPVATDSGDWICACGAENSGRFCPECGSPRPAAAPKCPGCGWTPKDSAPRFCPDCGTPFSR